MSFSILQCIINKYQSYYKDALFSCFFLFVLTGSRNFLGCQNYFSLKITSNLNIYS